ncbi:GNAT family N-acetyltransferase [Chelatococcus reniformis]|uniref:N-acetyltransferase n=1 Tax=Chelatococcus reniformis TaxID=1494448 RepID=A0A916XH63_9HYPH|nr:GNAT family N-acetyltransferase [Chelatococcus reniformis]GGC71571.1 N-acetyltransferase [Chelatococcus reniformis]
MSVITVRALNSDDRAAWEPLWRGYLDFYRTSQTAELKDLVWRRILDAGEPIHGLAAVAEGRIIGIVHYVFHRATWSATDYCYLEDLFTSPDARGKGVGRALIEAVYERARVHGSTRVYWLTHETNAPARLLYDQVAEFAGFIQYRKAIG